MANHHLGRRDVLTLAGLASARRSRLPLAGQTMTTPSKQSVEARRRELYALLGDLPDRRRPIGGKKRGEEERDGYILETWDLDLNGIETVPAYLARPRGLTRAGAGRRLRSLARRRLHDRQEGVHRGPPLPAAGSVCQGPDRPRLRRPRDRPLGLRRAQPHDRARHVQGHAVEGPGAVGHDGLRQPARARLAGHAPRRRQRARSARSGCRWGAPWRGGSRRSTSA